MAKNEVILVAISYGAAILFGLVPLFTYKFTMLKNGYKFLSKIAPFFIKPYPKFRLVKNKFVDNSKTNL